MKTIVFATNNPGKLKEVRSKLNGIVEVLSLNDLSINVDIPEDYETLEENALQKAKFIFDRVNIPCFSDDTGLEVSALNGDPGVYSARFAGPNCTPQDNIDKLLLKLGDNPNRSARFRTVIAFVYADQALTFEGVVEGEINTEMIGVGGFGYDPVFVPLHGQKTFAEMTLDEKNAISHRAKALTKFVEFMVAS